MKIAVIAGLICCIALVACAEQQQQSLTPVPATNLKGYEDDVSAVIEEQRKVCTQPDLQELFSKMPCKAEDATQEQRSDKSKISSTEKIPFLKWEDISAKSNQKLAAINRQYKFKSGEAVASLIEKGLVDSKKLASDFSNGRISWGEFNKRRKDAYTRYQDNLKRALTN